MTESASSDFGPHLARFGLSAFRPGQAEVISAVLAGEDCVCIMPTGGGKSLCYQLPSIMRPGVTLVVSPLIALMKDQVDSLVRQGVRATFINSSLTPSEQGERISAMQAGGVDLVYVAPERFRSPRFLDAVRQSKVQLLAIDEAHCISEWGHDFRPDYARIGRFRRQIGNPQTIALSATATPHVRADIVRQLGLESPRAFLAGFARPNLFYEVIEVAGVKDKPDVLLNFLKETPGTGIIYVSARKRCDEVAQLVASTGRRVGVYHAGLMPEERRQAQEDFMRGRYEIVVATVAFGMGIDKADVRFVVHYNMPGSVEAYYQEAGRAGRDGKPSRCLLIYTYGDRKIQEFFIESAYPDRGVIAEVYEFLRGLDDDPIELTQHEIKETLRLSVGPEGVGSCLQLLDKAGAVERLEPVANQGILRINSDAPTLVDFLPPGAKVQRKVAKAVEQIVGDRRFEDVYSHPRTIAYMAGVDAAAVTRALRELARLESFDYIPPFRGRAVRVADRTRSFANLEIDFAAYEKRKQAEIDKLEEVIRFATGRRCRQQAILHYFGDHSDEKCGHCDNCCGNVGRTTVSVADFEQQESPAKKRAAEKISRVVRIALSGVARADARVGKQAIAQMLSGSKSAKLSKLNLDHLSTFGLLADMRQSDVQSLLEAMLSVGLVEQHEVHRYRPVMRLTALGREVMTEKQPLPEHLQLSSELLSVVLRCIPRTGSSGDATAAALPAPPPSQKISSADEVTRRFDEAFNEDAADSIDEERLLRVDAPSNLSQPSFFWTWRLLSSDFSAQEICEIRGISAERVIDHAIQAVEAGYEVDPRQLLSRDQIALLEAAQRDAREADDGKPLMRLPPGIRPQQMMLFLRCRAAVS